MNLKLIKFMDDERAASQGLNIRGFHFKWKKAKEYELFNKRTDDTKLLPYWERVRLSFLELGGEYIGQGYGPQPGPPVRARGNQ